MGCIKKKDGGWWVNGGGGDGDGDGDRGSVVAIVSKVLLIGF